MAPSKATKHIRVKVPRHNSQRINAKLSAEVENQARMKRVLVDTAQPSSRLTQAIVSYSIFENKVFLMSGCIYILCTSRKALQIGIRY